jgi:hypothetical protein
MLLSPNGPLKATPSPLGEFLFYIYFQNITDFLKLSKYLLIILLHKFSCKKNFIFKSFHEVKKNLFIDIIYKYFNMLLDFLIHYLGFAFLIYVYQHFENNIILHNYSFFFFLKLFSLNLKVVTIAYVHVIKIAPLSFFALMKVVFDVVL